MKNSPVISCNNLHVWLNECKSKQWRFKLKIEDDNKVGFHSMSPQLAFHSNFCHFSESAFSDFHSQHHSRCCFLFVSIWSNYSPSVLELLAFDMFFLFEECCKITNKIKVQVISLQKHRNEHESKKFKHPELNLCVITNTLKY